MTVENLKNKINDQIRSGVNIYYRGNKVVEASVSGGKLEVRHGDDFHGLFPDHQSLEESDFWYIQNDKNESILE